MGLLKYLNLIALACIVSAVEAQADMFPFVENVELTEHGSLGLANAYTLGQGAQIYLGNEDDVDNHTAEIHFDYEADIADADGTNPTSSLTHLDSWLGGASIETWKSGTFGLDLDSLLDGADGFSIFGTKITFGFGVLKLSSRYAKNSLSLTTAIYQNTYGLDFDFRGKSDQVIFGGEISSFSPSNGSYVAILQSPGRLAALSAFPNAIQNFEQWSLNGSWSHRWGSQWDSTLIGRYSLILLNSNNLIEATIAGGYQFSPVYHLRLGYTFVNDTGVLSQSLIFTELRISFESSHRD